MSVSKKDYKDTVHLPQTSFPMKASLPESEPKRLKLWEEGNLYARIQKKWSGSRQKFILHDGPPYANGNIHIGHALNKILKDIIVKYKTMRGFNALYVPGWDCHGLPIEHQCLKEMGKRKDQVERVEFRKQARQYAERFIDIQRKEFKRLGVFGDWEHPYRTMDHSYQATIAESFISLYEKGFVEQRLKPVPWCWDCETALADAELEYEDKVSKSVYVVFPFLKNDFLKEFAKTTFSFLVWTTTPWTLPANVGLAVHPKLNYLLVETPRGNFIVAEDLFESVAMKLGWDHPKKRGKIEGAILKGSEIQHPFLPRPGKVILADYVSNTDGTGIVHIAPGHGEEDYHYGHLECGLPIISPVDEKGRFTKEFLPCEGINVFKANEKIVELLKEKRALLHVEDYQHSYPHCWRCKKPIIFRATPQWFLKIDHQDLRKHLGETIQKKIQFTPDWGKNRIGSMVETRPDWCLSRQRYWGVPIPIVRCTKCPNTFFVKELKEKLTKIFETESADAWFSRSATDFLPDGFKCPKCGGYEFKKEEDIIDVWFDSGVSHQAVLKKSKTLGYPADLYLEGSDQHRGWFQSALTTGIALDRESPFKGVLTHGFVVDGEGKKMSKSAGNVVRPQDVMKEFGADILRLWVSSCDYQFDVRLSKEILKQLTDQYRKVRNTFRYMLSNLFDFDPKKDRIALEKLHPLDQWAVTKVDMLIQNVIEEYDAYDFHAVFQGLHDFCSLDLSSYYFDVLKDTLYTARKDSFLRRSAQSGLFETLSRLVKVFAPILAFTMDEVWQSFPIEEGVTSVHEAGLEVLEKPFVSSSFNEWDKIRMVRNAIMPSLEKKRSEGLIRSSLDAKIYIGANDPKIQKVLQSNLNELRRVFIASQVHWLDGSREGMEEVEGGLTITVEKADGKKCDRCWNYSVEVGNFPEHPTLCERCVEAIYPTTCF
ncbi:MAG: isoleucine--tRNA ligase [Candidatus Omnitrophica bacterium]|nr:isoleucine--tRNA ligase [Candidatus Omnitrophota bacterium]